MPLPEFVPGLALSKAYYHEIIRPILSKDHPQLTYSAGLIGFGSDVIGLDTAMSRDHMWGPRMVLFLPAENFEDQKNAIDQTLQNKLPHSFQGYPTSFGKPDAVGVRLFEEKNAGPVYHLIEITTITSYFDYQLGAERWQNPNPADWLTFSEHILLSLTTGEIFHDELGLESIRKKLYYYPHDIWLYQMAAAWSQIAQEEPFVGRTGTVGDDLGSAILTARLVNVCMRLAFLQEKQYAPYSKWFGSAFQRLKSANTLLEPMQAALSANNWQNREKQLCLIYEKLLNNHNKLGLGAALEPKCSSFHGRPYQVIHGERVAEQITSLIADPALKGLNTFGSVNQFSPCCDLLEDKNALTRLTALYKN